MQSAAHSLLASLCVCAGLLAQTSPEALTPRQKQFVSVAVGFGCLSLWPTRGSFVAEPEADELARLNKVLSGAEIQPLLKHSDARVRAAAIVALNLRGEARWLPSIAELQLDTAQAPQKRLHNNVALIVGPEGEVTPSGPAYTPKPQTIGELAKGVIRPYLSNRGKCFLHGDRGHWPNFEEYWGSHAGLKTCLCWNLTALWIASQGSRPLAENRKAAVRQLRGRIDGIESPLREWILLGVGARYWHGEGLAGAKELVSEAELLQAARELGEPKLMAFLRGKEALALGRHYAAFHRSEITYWRIAQFLLSHATELIPKADPAELVALDRMRTERVRVGSSPAGAEPMYAIAAANLAPQEATEILVDALKRHANLGYRSSRESSIAHALWVHGGLRQLDQIQGWFYGLNESGNQGQLQGAFLRGCTGVEHKPLLRALLVVPSPGNPHHKE